MLLDRLNEIHSLRLRSVRLYTVYPYIISVYYISVVCISVYLSSFANFFSKWEYFLCPEDFFLGNNKTELDGKLRELNVTRLFIAGLATDVCVAATASDASNLNYTTYVIEDASRGISSETITAKLSDLTERGVGIIRANQVKSLVNSGSRLPLHFVSLTVVNIVIFLFK